MQAEEKQILYDIFEILQERGFVVSKETLASRLRRLHLGLSAEEEFAVLLSWLGKCRLVHKLDQKHAPTEDYLVPDLLAIFDHNGRPLPILIEVKAKRKLSWRPEDYAALLRYGDEVGLPVLIAWRHPQGRLWALCELRHAKMAVKNYNLSFSEALTNSLMSALAGDFSYKLRPGLALHLHIKKLSPVTPGPAPGESRFEGEIERAYFALSDGKPLKEPRGLLWLFIAVEDEVSSDEDETHVHQTYTTLEGPSQFAHRVLPAVLAMSAGDESIRWHELRRSGCLPTSGPQLAAAAQDAAKVGAIENQLLFRPKKMPDFLK